MTPLHFIAKTNSKPFKYLSRGRDGQLEYFGLQRHGGLLYSVAKAKSVGAMANLLGSMAKSA